MERHWALYRFAEIKKYRESIGWKGARRACLLAGRSEFYFARAFFGHYGF